jgi:hypothetical protein
MTAPFRKGLTIGFLLLFPLPILAAEDAIESQGATITVRVWDRAQIDASILENAKQVSEQLFHPMRIEIRWVDCLADPTPQNQRCISPAGPNDISVRIYRRPTEQRQQLGHTTAGVALPSPLNGGSGFIQVFFDRLEEIYQDRKGEAPLGLILGLTITHEIGHLLLPGKQHSLSGIMQGCVGLRNLRLAARGWMRFTVEQRRVIGANVRKWSNLSESNAKVYAQAPALKATQAGAPGRR